MSIALCFTSLLLFAGQTSTQTPQPVQSSGATWIVSSVRRGSSRERNGFDEEARRARRPRRPAGYTFMRIAACGQTIAHLPQSMQSAGSQIGISCAMRALLVARGARSGRCRRAAARETGQQVALPGEQRARSRAARSRAPPRARGARRATSERRAPPGIATRCSSPSARSTAARLRATTAGPRFA